MKLTTKGRYGIRAVINLALAAKNTPISIKSIAEQEGISPIFLEQIFYLLKKQGIISSVRGPGGGFVIKKPLSEISLKDILQAVGENIFIVPCTQKQSEKEICGRLASCKMSSVWHNFHNMINGYLTKVTLQDIIMQEGAAKLDPAKIPADKIPADKIPADKIPAEFCAQESNAFVND
jgi:Rrf2 family iron-sulfur cluster assembly transcriptional regulator